MRRKLVLGLVVALLAPIGVVWAGTGRTASGSDTARQWTPSLAEMRAAEAAPGATHEGDLPAAESSGRPGSPSDPSGFAVRQWTPTFEEIEKAAAVPGASREGSLAACEDGHRSAVSAQHGSGVGNGRSTLNAWTYWCWSDAGLITYRSSGAPQSQGQECAPAGSMALNAGGGAGRRYVQVSYEGWWVCPADLVYVWLWTYHRPWSTWWISAHH